MFKKILKNINTFDTPTKVDKSSYEKLQDSLYQTKKSSKLNCCNIEKLNQSHMITAAWYHPKYSQKKSTRVLSNMNPGSFIVRNSRKKCGCYILSVRAEDVTIHHFLIYKTIFGFRIQVIFKIFHN